MNMNHPFYDEIKHDEPFKQIIRRIEQEHGSRMKRIPRFAHDEETNKFYFTIVLENYLFLEVCLDTTIFQGMPALEIEVEVW